MIIGNDRKSLISLLTFYGIAVIILLINLLTPHSGNALFASLINPVILVTGLGFMRKNLQFYFQDKIVTITLVLLAFATNLFFIGVFSNIHQPLLLFTFYSVLVYLTIRWHLKPSLLIAVFLGVITGLIIMVHPIGYSAVLIPVLWNISDKTSWKEKIRLIRDKWSHFIVFISLSVLINIIALLTLDVRPGEIPFLDITLPGLFTFGSRYFWNDLFSFDHGLFIYSPVFILAVIGFYFFAEKNRPIFYPVFIICIFDLLGETCWSVLGETPVFGQIAFIPVYALLIFPIASFIGFIFSGKLFSRITVTVVMTAFIILNIFQTWQFNAGLILHSGMTMSIYGQVFGQTVLPGLSDQQLTGMDMDPKKTLLFNDENRFSKILLASYDFENPNVPYKNNLENKFVKSGKAAFTMDSISRYSPTWEIKYKDFMRKPLIGMRITASVFTTNLFSLANVNLVITSAHEGKLYRYKTIDLGNLNLKPGVWNTVSMDYLISHRPDPADELISYVYYTGNSVIYIDDLKFEAFVRK
jgi:hypothetical protein